MKTYWLEKREIRSQSTKNISIQEPPQWQSAGGRNSLTRNCLDSIQSSSQHHHHSYHQQRHQLSSSPSGAAARLAARLPNSPTAAQLTYPTIPIMTAMVATPTTSASNPGIFHSEERPIYSPITFQDVARRSVANSPTKSLSVKGKSYVVLVVYSLLLREINFLKMIRQ